MTVCTQGIMQWALCYLAYRYAKDDLIPASLQIAFVHAACCPAEENMLAHNMRCLSTCNLKTASVHYLDGWYGSWEMHAGQQLIQVLLHCRPWHTNLHLPHNGRHHPGKDG